MANKNEKCTLGVWVKSNHWWWMLQVKKHHHSFLLDWFIDSCFLGCIALKGRWRRKFHVVDNQSCGKVAIHVILFHPILLNHFFLSARFFYPLYHRFTIIDWERYADASAKLTIASCFVFSIVSSVFAYAVWQTIYASCVGRCLLFIHVAFYLPFIKNSTFI